MCSFWFENQIWVEMNEKNICLKRIRNNVNKLVEPIDTQTYW